MQGRGGRSLRSCSAAAFYWSARGAAAGGGRRNGRRICAAAARPWRGAPPGGDRPDPGAGERPPSRVCWASGRTASPGPRSRPPGPAAAPMIWLLRTAEQRGWWPAATGLSSRMPGAPGRGRHPQTELDARAARVTRCPWVQPRAPGPAAAGPGPWVIVLTRYSMALISANSGIQAIPDKSLIP